MHSRRLVGAAEPARLVTWLVWLQASVAVHSVRPEQVRLRLVPVGLEMCPADDRDRPDGCGDAGVYIATHHTSRDVSKGSALGDECLHRLFRSNQPQRRVKRTRFSRSRILSTPVSASTSSAQLAGCGGCSRSRTGRGFSVACPLRARSRPRLVASKMTPAGGVASMLIARAPGDSASRCCSSPLRCCSAARLIEPDTCDEPLRMGRDERGRRT